MKYYEDERNFKKNVRFQVRDLWGRLAELQSKQIADREIVDSILLGTVEKYKIDSSDLNIKVPDLLLRECEQEIQRVSCTCITCIHEFIFQISSTYLLFFCICKEVVQKTQKKLKKNQKK